MSKRQRQLRHKNVTNLSLVSALYSMGVISTTAATEPPQSPPYIPGGVGSSHHDDASSQQGPRSFSKSQSPRSQRLRHDESSVEVRAPAVLDTTTDDEAQMIPSKKSSSFPAVHTLSMSREQLFMIHNNNSNITIREGLAELDLLHIDCTDNNDDSASSCRLQVLLHSESEWTYFQNTYHWSLEMDEEATDALLRGGTSSRQLLAVSFEEDDANSEETMEASEFYQTHSNRTDMLFDVGYSRIQGYPCYLDYQGMNDWIHDLTASTSSSSGDLPTRPSVRSTPGIRENIRLSYTDIGDSYLKTQDSCEGHDIMVLKISADDSTTSTTATTTKKAPMMILTGIHPREYAPPETMRRWIQWLITTSDLDAQLILETTDIYWIPYVNPDGRVLAETTQPLRRKNQNAQANGSKSCKPSEFGVDLNRNFPFRYGRSDGSSSNPCLQTFRGDGPASEPEVQAVIRLGHAIFPHAQLEHSIMSQSADVMEGDKIFHGEFKGYNERTTTGIFLDLHSFGNYYIYPWGFENSNTGNHKGLTAMAHKLSYFTEYDIQGPGFDYAGAASGATDDWAYASLGAAGMTWELGTTFHQDCSGFADEILPSNLQALTYAAKLAHRPYRMAKGPDITLLELESVVVSNGEDLKLIVEASDDAYSNSWMVQEATQDIDSIMFFLDTNPYATWPENESLWRIQANWILTTQDGQLSKRGRGSLRVPWSDLEDAILPTGSSEKSSSAVQHHTIYSLAVDEDGYPGVLSAVHFTVDLSSLSIPPSVVPSDMPSLMPSSSPSETGHATACNHTGIDDTDSQGCTEEVAISRSSLNETTKESQLPLPAEEVDHTGTSTRNSDSVGLAKMSWWSIGASFMLAFLRTLSS